jgi:hypothetical protein
MASIAAQGTDECETLIVLYLSVCCALHSRGFRLSLNAYSAEVVQAKKGGEAVLQTL